MKDAPKSAANASKAEATPEALAAEVESLAAMLRRERLLRETLAREALRDLLSRYQVRLVSSGDVQLVAE